MSPSRDGWNRGYDKLVFLLLIRNNYAITRLTEPRSTRTAIREDLSRLLDGEAARLIVATGGVLVERPTAGALEEDRPSILRAGHLCHVAKPPILIVSAVVAPEDQSRVPSHNGSFAQNPPAT